MAATQLALDFSAVQPKKRLRPPTANENNRRYRERLKAREPVPPPAEKRCCHCKLVKPSSEFHRNKSDPGGLARRCKACKALEHAARYQQRISGEHTVPEKHCIGCDLVKPADAFYKQTAAADGLSTYCRECDKPRLAEYYSNNSDRVKLGAWLWAKRNPERANASAIASAHTRRVKDAGGEGSFTGAEWLELLDEHGHRCAYCNLHEDEVGKLTTDHVIPIRKGGTGYIDNVVPACRRCNGIKGTKTLSEFAAWLEFRASMGVT